MRKLWSLSVFGRTCNGIVVLICISLSISCSSSYQAPVGELGDGRVAGRNHRVNGGETLYAIAWMYDLNYSQLARINNISEPYVIIPGEILSLDVGLLESRSSVSAPISSTTPSVNRNATNPTGPANNSGRTIVIPVPVPRAAVQSSALAGPVSWSWPAAGNIIGRFSATGLENKGIDISGREGEQVVAAASGEVVYAGRGLLRYGDLIIIKHNDQFLSAYAHNSQLLINEGDLVSRGQKIAELGSTGIDRDMLHFEIRLEGQPVDPMRYLPAR